MMCELGGGAHNSRQRSKYLPPITPRKSRHRRELCILVTTCKMSKRCIVTGGNQGAHLPSHVGITASVTLFLRHGSGHCQSTCRPGMVRPRAARMPLATHVHMYSCHFKVCRYLRPQRRQGAGGSRFHTGCPIPHPSKIVLLRSCMALTLLLLPWSASSAKAADVSFGLMDLNVGRPQQPLCNCCKQG